MKYKVFLMSIGTALMLAGCGQELAALNTVATNSLEENSSAPCEAGELVLDKDEDPDWEIDVDGDCKGDIEFEGNEKKVKKKPSTVNSITNTPKKNTY